MRNMTKEFKVGLMIVLSILILIGIVIKTGDIDFNKRGYNIKVQFSFAAGITENAPVRLAGVEVGKVEDIQLSYGDDTKVLMNLRLNSTTRLRADSRAFISSLGLMGEKYIEINPGSRDAPFLEADSTIIGEDPFQMEWFTEKGESLAENLELAIKDIDALANNVNDMVIENREEIDKIMENMEETSQNLKELSGDIRKHPWKVITKPPGWKKMITEED